MSEKKHRPLLKTKITKASSVPDNSSLKYKNELRLEDNASDQRGGLLLSINFCNIVSARY